MGKNCQEHKILLQKAIQNEIHPVSGSSNRDKIPLVSENSYGAVQRNYGEQENQYKCLRIQHWEKTMENKDKRNGKQQNNQASDREKKVFLDEQYVKTAAQMERELFADKDFEDYEPEDSEAEARSYEKLVNRLRKEGVYREEFADMAEFPDIEEVGPEEAMDEEVEDIKAEDIKAEDIKAPQVPSSGRKKYARVHVGKVAGVALLCCACIFAASMTSQANRNYLVNNIRVWSGNDTKTVVDNSEQNEKVDTAEYEAVEEIEKQLGVEIPEFYYRPNGFEFVSYEVDTLTDIARIEYSYKDNIVLYIIDCQKNNMASKTFSMHGETIGTVIADEEEIRVEIEKIENPGDFMPSYTAQWRREETVFTLSGKIEEEELKKIFKDMVY